MKTPCIMMLKNKIAMVIKNSTFRLLLPLLATAFIVSCSHSGSHAPTKRAAVIKPFKNIDIAATTFSIDPGKDEILRMPSGTQISIPANTITDVSGKVISTSVTIRFREFHTPAEIIASGITMNYDSAGSTHAFKSAGMFEMGATSNNQEVYIKKGGSIHVDLASSQTDGTYNFYRLDTATATWSYLNTTSPEPNAMRKETETEMAAEAEPVKPTEPTAYDGKASTFDLDFDEQAFPGLAGYSGVMWQFADASEESKNKWVYETEWNSAVLAPGDEASGTYTMRLATVGKSFSAAVKPVLSGSHFKDALVLFQEKMKAFEERKSKRDLRRQELLNMAEYQRSVDIGSFGTYNCDHIHAEPMAIQIEPQFNFSDDEFSANPDLVCVYMLIGTDKTPVRYFAENPLGFFYAPDKANRLVAVLEGGNKALIINASDFQKQAESKVFSFSSTARQVGSMSDLKSMLDNL